MVSWLFYNGNMGVNSLHLHFVHGNEDAKSFMKVTIKLDSHKAMKVINKLNE